jgi:hypothetical protein
MDFSFETVSCGCWSGNTEARNLEQRYQGISTVSNKVSDKFTQKFLQNTEFIPLFTNKSLKINDL